MKNVSISVGHYERQSFPWDKLTEDFRDHAKYQIIQQVRQFNILSCELKIIGLSTLFSYYYIIISVAPSLESVFIMASLVSCVKVYVLVLGLDILGNPYQRLRDLSQGVKDLIYQPALVGMATFFLWIN